MALLPILCYPDPKLHTVARPVPAVDARIKALIADMLETMYDADGIGLAATQVDVHERLIVIDVSGERKVPLVLINPEIKWASEEPDSRAEESLSVIWHLRPTCRLRRDAPQGLKTLEAAVKLVPVAIANTINRVRLGTKIAIGVLPKCPGVPGLRYVLGRRSILCKPEKTLREQWVGRLASQLLFDQRARIKTGKSAGHFLDS